MLVYKTYICVVDLIKVIRSAPADQQPTNECIAKMLEQVCDAF
jgi:hypothetical protein